MLHGGRADGLADVEESSASWRRSRWMMQHVAPRLHREGVAVWLLRYGVRGWNAGPGVVPSPVSDARWALEQVHRELPEVPVVLLGHSMGGRTAVAVADDPGVVGVVALAPWLPPGEPHGALTGKQLAVAHGRRDRITSLPASRAFCQGAQAVAGVELRDMGRVGHYMLRHVADWNTFAVTRSLRQLGVH
jgi:predicted alpha/beta-hydrolase family hydrolase